MNTITLQFRIIVHARLFFLQKKIALHALIRVLHDYFISENSMKIWVEKRKNDRSHPNSLLSTENSLKTYQSQSENRFIVSVFGPFALMKIRYIDPTRLF